MASLSTPYNYKHFTDKLYLTNPLSSTPLNTTRRTQIRTPTIIKIMEASACGPSRMPNTHLLMVVSILKWNG
jgi:hypothetical protein